MLRVAVERPANVVSDTFTMVRPHEGGRRGNFELHAEMPGEAEEVRGALPALLGSRLIGVVEVTAEQPKLFHLRHHGIGNRIGHGGVQEVVSDGLERFRDGEGHGHRVLRVGRTRDDGPIMAPERVPIGGEAFCLVPEVVHHPEFVVSEHAHPEVDGPGLFPLHLAGIRADGFHQLRVAGPEADEGHGSGARLQAVGWVHVHHP